VKRAHREFPVQLTETRPEQHRLSVTYSIRCK
jgi:hypothetical protein